MSSERVGICRRGTSRWSLPKGGVMNPKVVEVMHVKR
jgi:hypothetical protein